MASHWKQGEVRYTAAFLRSIGSYGATESERVGRVVSGKTLPKRCNTALKVVWKDDPTNEQWVLGSNLEGRFGNGFIRLAHPSSVLRACCIDAYDIMS